MFTNDQRNHILVVKSKIDSIIVELTKEPWAMNNVTLPWSDMYISGGMIASLLQGEDYKDIDLYCETEIALTDVKNYLLTQRDHIKSCDESYDNFMPEGKMITESAITMKGNYQFVTMFFGRPEQVKKYFDYVHCTPHYSLRTGRLYISEQQYDCIINKRLVINNPDAIKTFRNEKFLSRGYYWEKQIKQEPLPWE